LHVEISECMAPQEISECMASQPPLNREGEICSFLLLFLYSFLFILQTLIFLCFSLSLHVAAGN